MGLEGDWSSAALDRHPVAADVGPFPRRGFLEAWWTHRSSGELLLADDGRVALPLHLGPDGVAIAGEEDLTDYHCPLGGRLDDLVAFGGTLAGALPPGTPFRLDSLPGEVAERLAGGMRTGGVAVAVRRHEAAAVLGLPADHGAYLDGLRAKDRHEMRRKRRRFTEILGDPQLVHGPGGFDAFVEMHRASEGSKGEFMDEPMAGFFGDLLGLEGAVLSLLMGGADPVAAAFGFEDDGVYYLYNSAYAPRFGGASPGVILVDCLVETAIAAGKRRFDFLKGDEAYKFRMGAVARPLFVLEGTT